MSITEKEKMLSGKMYQAFDPVLSAERLAARETVYDINQLRPRDIDSRNALIKKLFGRTEETFHIEPPFNCDYGYNISIGNHFYANFNLVILDCAPVSFGNHVFIGPNVGIYTAGHPL
ncbi:MAG: maltose O-acetyltransferase, partial [Chryseobacterium sp.]